MTATDSASTETSTIERFDLTVGPFTFQARRAGPRDGRPVILLHGVPQTSACWIAQLEGIGHWIPETAADRFNEELLDHLRRHPP